MGHTRENRLLLTAISLMFLALATLVVCPTASAQDDVDEEQQRAAAGADVAAAAGLFQVADVGLVGDDRTKLAEAYEDEEGVEAVEIVTLDTAALMAGTPLTLNAAEGAPATASASVAPIAADDDARLWTGTSTKGQTSLMVINGDMVSGFVDQGDKVFEVRPLGGGLHALVTIDPSELMDEEDDVEIKRPEAELNALLAGLPEEDAIPLVAQIRRQDLLVAYTPAMAAAYADPTGHILLAVERSNLSYRESGVNILLNPVHIYQTNYTESGSSSTEVNRFQNKSDGFMDEVHGLRQQHGADMCMLMTSTLSGCGRAYVIYADKPEEAFAVTKASCAVGNLTFAHELGHLQGARHNIEVDSSTSPFAYGHGFWNSTARVRSVMSYANPCSACVRVPRWSGPGVTFNGTTMGNAATSHNARVLNLTATKIAGHVGQPGGGTGYAWAYDPTNANYIVGGSYKYNSAGGDIRIQRKAKGYYRVTFYGLGGNGTAGGHVQATKYGSDPGYATVQSWGSSGKNFIIYVRLFNASGAALDGRFNIKVDWLD